MLARLGPWVPAYGSTGPTGSSFQFGMYCEETGFNKSS